MKDWEKWFDKMSIISDPETWKGDPVRATISIEEERYKTFIARMKDEGLIDEKAKPRKKSEPKEAWNINEFEAIWKNYPKKTAKKAALKAWNNLKPNTELIEFMFIHFEAAYKGTEKQFVPNFSTYINQARWNDEVIEVKPKLLAVPSDDDALWPFATKHGLRQPGTMNYFSYRNALRKEVEKKQLMAES